MPETINRKAAAQAASAPPAAWMELVRCLLCCIPQLGARTPISRPAGASDTALHSLQRRSAARQPIKRGMGCLKGPGTGDGDALPG